MQAKRNDFVYVIKSKLWDIYNGGEGFLKFKKIYRSDLILKTHIDLIL